MINKKNHDHDQQEPTQFNNGSCIYNGIFGIYGEINDSLGMNFIVPLYEEIEKRKKENTPNAIKVFLDSPGGDLDISFDIIGLFEYARKNNVPIHTYVLSFVGSAGSLIAVCGHKRFVTKRSYEMLHFPAVQTYVNNPEMAERNTENYQFLQNQLLNIYKDNVNIKQLVKDRKKKTFGELLQTDSLNIHGDDLLKYKFADELLY